MKRLILGIFLVVWWCGNLVCAQDIAVKTNLLYWATSTPNIGFEFGLGKRTTLDLVGGYNPWTLNKDDNKKIKHWMVMPEFRYWLCERFNGHFFGIHTGFAEYNISGVRIPFQNKSTQEHRYEGWATGIGISYGYTWILGKRWNLEANIGAGGAPINFVYHATQLGAEGYAVSAVGNDVFGTEIVQELDKNGICPILSYFI